MQNQSDREDSRNEKEVRLRVEEFRARQRIKNLVGYRQGEVAKSRACRMR